MKRIVLFLATNLAVLVLLSITARLLGVDRLTGYPMTQLLIFAAVIGMGGAFISLALSKWIAKFTTGAQVIEQPRNSTESWLMDTIRQHAKRAGIGMPEVAVYDSPDMNAFATGMRRNHALVAVSTGLLRSMDHDEVEAVLGHEITHVANGDMVTLALIQGVLNTFVVFLARIIGNLVDSAISRNDNRQGYGIGYWVVTMIAEVVLGIFASMIVMWFSRYREFRADAGGAKLAGRDKMIAALQRLKANIEEPQLPQQMRAFGIAGGGRRDFSRLFMSHPPLDERIAALQAGA